MQFFYQFPARVERLVLISSGGLGHEVSPMLRTAALPGMSALLSLAALSRLPGALCDVAECATGHTYRRLLVPCDRSKGRRLARPSCRRCAPSSTSGARGSAPPI